MKHPMLGSLPVRQDLWPCAGKCDRLCDIRYISGLAIGTRRGRGFQLSGETGPKNLVRKGRKLAFLGVTFRDFTVTEGHAWIMAVRQIAETGISRNPATECGDVRLEFDRTSPRSIFCKIVTIEIMSVAQNHAIK